jgi:hypothetical protein
MNLKEVKKYFGNFNGVVVEPMPGEGFEGFNKGDKVLVLQYEEWKEFYDTVFHELDRDKRCEVRGRRLEKVRQILQR